MSTTSSVLMDVMDRMKAHLKQEVAEKTARIAELEAEYGQKLGRWQDAVRGYFVGNGVDPSKIDGGGCGSGDPMDFMLAELSQGASYLRETDEARIVELETALTKMTIERDKLYGRGISM